MMLVAVLYVHRDVTGLLRELSSRFAECNPQLPSASSLRVARDPTGAVGSDAPINDMVTIRPGERRALWARVRDRRVFGSDRDRWMVGLFTTVFVVARHSRPSTAIVSPGGWTGAEPNQIDRKQINCRRFAVKTLVAIEATVVYCQRWQAKMEIPVDYANLSVASS